ncbi:hypothetical protein BRADI_3g04106v3 [Brachypodium distachyon]|uniref:Uncharacterized protein n=1 Tax=Brachypodium distachyon TaxID=15368 RepID=I1HXB0_BRADI|nr:hypothetical protein BRADI_3g04106v3 [Brachypodium distachyon]
MASVARNTMLLLVLVGIVVQLSSVVPAAAAERTLVDQVGGAGGSSGFSDMADASGNDASAYDDGTNGAVRRSLRKAAKVAKAGDEEED